VDEPPPLGPAIVRDAWRYAERRLRDLAPAPHDGCSDEAQAGALADALVLFVLPQYGGLDAPAWARLCDRLAEALAEGAPPAGQCAVADRMRQRLDAARRGLLGELR
jgi:hypothetical protein